MAAYVFLIVQTNKIMLAREANAAYRKNHKKHLNTLKRMEKFSILYHAVKLSLFFEKLTKKVRRHGMAEPGGCGF